MAKQKPPKEDLVIVKNHTPFMLVLPALVVLISIVGYPLFWSLYYSLHQYNPIAGAAKFIGVGNYKWLFTLPRFWKSVKNLAYYLLVGVSIQMIMALVVALLLYELIGNRRLQLIFLVIFIIPMMMPPSVVGVLWRFILNPMGGVVNAILYAVFGKEPINWLSPKLALTSIMIADIWEWTSLPLMIIYSGRVSLPELPGKFPQAVPYLLAQ